MRDIEEERQEAQDYAIRAAFLEDLGMKGAARIFRELIKLCDRKIFLLKEVEEQRKFLENIRTASQASVLGEQKTAHKSGDISRE